MHGRNGPNRVWRIRLAWAGLVVVLYSGVAAIVAVLHPHGKHDPKAIPVALCWPRL
jgi:hypothetical protein